MNTDGKPDIDLIKAKRTVLIWIGLFAILVLVVGVILYNGVVGVPPSATFLQNYSLDSSKAWDTFKDEHPGLDPNLLSTSFAPAQPIWVNISGTGLLDEMARPKSVVTFQVTIRANSLDKSSLKLQSLLVLLLDQNGRIRGKIFVQQGSPDFFLGGNNETVYAFLFNVPSDMQDQRYSVIVELLGILDTSDSINYQQLGQQSYYLTTNDDVYGVLPSWNYQDRNSAYFKLQSYSRTEMHTPQSYSFISLASYSWTLAGALSVLFTFVIWVKDRSANWRRENKPYIIFGILFLILFIMILFLATALL
jgi:hypothetical protein